MAVHARLKGHSADLETLARQFGAGDPVVGVDADGYYFVTSQDFDGLLSDGVRLYEIASSTVRRLNGVMSALDSNFHAVEVVPRFSNEDGSVVSALAFAEPIELRATAGTPTVMVDGVVRAPSPAPGPQLHALAQKHPDAAELLEIMSKGMSQLDWFDLYKVYEIIRANVGGSGNNGTDEQRLRATKWLSLADHHGFHNSANTRSISGDAARHARGQQPRTADAMTLQEGKEVINRLVRRWLNSLP